MNILINKHVNKRDILQIFSLYIYAINQQEGVSLFRIILSYLIIHKACNIPNQFLELEDNYQLILEENSNRNIIQNIIQLCFNQQKDCTDGKAMNNQMKEIIKQIKLLGEPSSS
ncbi:hypothetical protein ABPG74_015293 [Tetrahymena malaccensis]